MSSAYQLFGKLVCDLDIEGDLATVILDRLVEADRLDDKLGELDKLNTTMSLECSRQERKVELLTKACHGYDTAISIVGRIAGHLSAGRIKDSRKCLCRFEMLCKKAEALYGEAQGE